MLKIVVFILLTLLFSGCQNSSQSNDSEISSSSNKLTILRAPTSSDIVAINQQIVLEFSDELDPATVNTETIMIMHSTLEGELFVNCALTVKGEKVIITPYQYFKPASNFVLTVSLDVKDQHGRSLSEVYTYPFTTSNDAIDTSALKLRATKPSASSANVLVQTDIVADFNKNLSTEPEHSGANIVQVKNETNGTLISGKLSVFNSLLRFEPDSPLPYDANISVALTGSVADLYGNYYTSYDTLWFKTQQKGLNPVDNVGFASLGQEKMGENSVMVRALYDDVNNSKIVVATNTKLKLYNLKYGEFPVKPTLSYLGSYSLSNIKSMVLINHKYLVVGTSDTGLYTLKADSSGVSVISHIDSGKAIYRVNYGYDYQNSRVNKIYAVGPLYGMGVFDFNDTDGSVVLSKSVDTNNTAYLDLLQAQGSDVNGTFVKRVYVADYNGGVDIYDENGTKLTRTDLNGSIKKLTLKQDYSGNITGLYAISSSGKIKQLDLNGSISYNTVPELTGGIADVISYIDSTTTYASLLYYAQLEKGVLIVNDTTPEGIIKTGKTIVSVDIAKGYGGKPFLLTLSQDGTLSWFNAKADTYSPSYYSSPYNGSYADANTTIMVDFYDDYLDTASISEGSFSIVDENTSDSVDFDYSVGYDQYSSLTHTLKPKTHLTSQHTYKVKIEGSVSDMIGNKLNDGNGSTFSFTVN